MNTLLFFIHVSIISACSASMLLFGVAGLTAWICLQTVLANLFVVKQIALFGFGATASDAYIVGSTLTLNVLQEWYGPIQSRKAVHISFILLIFYTIASYIHGLYIPTIADQSSGHYAAIMTHMPRITLASLATYFIVQMLDTYWYAYLKRSLHSRYVYIRSLISIITTQAADTLLFSFLGLYGILPSIWSVIAISFIIKVISCLFMTPLVVLLSKYIKKKHNG